MSVHGCNHPWDSSNSLQEDDPRQPLLLIKGVEPFTPLVAREDVPHCAQKLDGKICHLHDSKVITQSLFQYLSFSLLDLDHIWS